MSLSPFVLGHIFGDIDHAARVGVDAPAAINLLERDRRPQHRCLYLVEPRTREGKTAGPLVPVDRDISQPRLDGLVTLRAFRMYLVHRFGVIDDEYVHL